MKKVLIILFLGLLFCNTGFAENYYFKECKISETVSADYIVDLEKNQINVTFKAKDGTSQKISDKIKSIDKDLIVSEKIKSGAGKNYYFQYYLNVGSNSVTKQTYKKESDYFKLDGPIRETYCTDVKADWNLSEKKEKPKKKAKDKKLQAESKLLKCQGNNIKQWTNCQGTYKYDSEVIYSGIFKNGKIFEGSATYPGGSKYVGRFKDNKPFGKGTFLFADGSKYIGEWKDGKGHGQGIKTWKDGREYAGEFKNDKPHGKGTFNNPDGSKYIGEFKNGKRHGKGTLTFSDGTAYIGKFIEGNEHGEGICINEEGSSVDCRKLKTKSGNTPKEKNTHSISVIAKKWVTLTDYKSNSGKMIKVLEKLKNDFKNGASKVCAVTGNYETLEQVLVTLEIDETPAFGLEPKVKIGMDSVIKCK